MKASISFFLLKEKRNKSPEQYIYARVTVDGLRCAVSTGHKVLKSNWSSTKSQVKIRDDRAFKINKDLNRIYEELYSIYEDLRDNKEYITSKLIVDIYKGKASVSNNTVMVSSVFDRFIDYKKAEGASEKRIESIEVTKVNVMGYLGRDVPLFSLGNSFYPNLKIYLHDKKKLSKSTVNQYIGVTKSTLDYGEIIEPKFRNPRQFITNYKVERMYRAHSQEEVKKILEAEVPEKLQLAFKMYQFQLKTGMGFSELQAFDPKKHIVRNIHDKKEWINIRRKKTGSLCEIPLDLGGEIPELGGLRELIDYFKAKKRKASNRFIEPYISVGKYNLLLGEIAKHLGIKKFTSHVARHTFATLAINGGWPSSAVARMIGDTIQVTERVYANLDSRRIIKERANMKEKFGS